MLTIRDLLREATVKRELVDHFLDPDAPNWATFDSELGYRLHDCIVRDGLDDSLTVYRYDASGARRQIHYAQSRCRINTYGDSFTQCHQVSDGETWQEYLAAHLGEPIRNFGVGGYGVYQAYRRMRREEQTSASAPNVVLNIWRDDHFRSLYTWRWLHTSLFRHTFARDGAFGTQVSMFHANPWAHLRLSLSTGDFEEHENPYPTPDSLYLLCDEEHVYERFRRDVDVQLFAAQQHAVDVDLALLRRVADALGQTPDFSSPESTADTARHLMHTCALRSSMYVVERTRAFAADSGKRLLLLLSYSSADVAAALRGEARFDQPLLDYLTERQYPVVDGLQKHVEDFAAYRCTPDEYVRRFYIGHYNPRGNHFFAFAIKAEVVAWLDPKPPAYDRHGDAPLQELAATLA